MQPERGDEVRLGEVGGFVEDDDGEPAVGEGAGPAAGVLERGAEELAAESSGRLRWSWEDGVVDLVAGVVDDVAGCAAGSRWRDARGLFGEVAANDERDDRE